MLQLWIPYRAPHDVYSTPKFRHSGSVAQDDVEVTVVTHFWTRSTEVSALCKGAGKQVQKVHHCLRSDWSINRYIELHGMHCVGQLSQLKLVWASDVLTRGKTHSALHAVSLGKLSERCFMGCTDISGRGCVLIPATVRLRNFVV